MLDWIIAGLIVAVAAVALGRMMVRSMSDKRPTCACGHVDCPLVGECAHYPYGPPDSKPAGCPLAQEADRSHLTPTRPYE